jgi:hypothetical protein
MNVIFVFNFSQKRHPCLPLTTASDLIILLNDKHKCPRESRASSLEKWRRNGDILLENTGLVVCFLIV